MFLHADVPGIARDRRCAVSFAGPAGDVRSHHARRRSAPPRNRGREESGGGCVAAVAIDGNGFSINHSVGRAVESKRDRSGLADAATQDGRVSQRGVATEDDSSARDGVDRGAGCRDDFQLGRRRTGDSVVVAVAALGRGPFIGAGACARRGDEAGGGVGECGAFVDYYV